MQLRDYQQGAIESLKQRLQAGSKRPVVQAPTGAGKTVIAAAIVKMAREKGKRIIFTVPSLSLIDQTVARFQANGIHEIGVIQAMHEMTDITQPVQVCSVQTLARREIPKADLVIVDECHVMFKIYDKWMAHPDWKDVPFIGLTATPWSKGMGAEGRWDDLIIVTTTDNLSKLGHLSDFKTYAPAHPDLDAIKTVAGDYDLKGLGEAMDQTNLVADIVSTWLEKGQDRQTVCFCVNRLHAKNVQQQFMALGVAAEYMDAYSTIEERNEIVRKFANGDVRIICNVGVLTTGFDADVRCIILARPTKSEILYAQMIGRGLRTANGKDHCLILDHSDTTLRLGFVTDLHRPVLDDGSKRQCVAVKKECLPKECPKCTFVKPVSMRVCPACGFQPEPKNKVEVDDGELYEISRDKKQKIQQITMAEQQTFFSELLLHAQLRGYKQGWAAYAFKERFKRWPGKELIEQPAASIGFVTQNWIIARNIRKARSKQSSKSFSKFLDSRP